MKSRYNVHIGTVFIRVKDIKRSKKWYQENLDLFVNWEMDNICAFKLGETDITLVQQELDVTKDVTFNIFCNDIIGRRDKFLERGICVSELKEWNNITYFSLKDPDSNLLEICSIK